MSNKLTKNELHDDIVQILEDSASHMADYVKHPGFAVTDGTANTYTVTLNPAPTGYVDGMAIVIKVNVDSTGSSTLNVNSLGAKVLKTANGKDALNLKAGGIYTFRYNSTTGNFMLQGEGVDATDLIIAANSILGS